jgi:hypothetical protein
MKKLMTSLMVAALMAAPIGCGGGPGSSGDNPGGDGTPISTGDVGPGGETKKSPAEGDPKTGEVTTDADVLKLQGEGGEADPLAPINKGGGGN